jgi:hypothetical protein
VPPRRRCAQVRKLASHIFLLTRVTRIFEKSVLTKVAPTGPRGMLLRAFCRADARAAAQVALLSRPRQGEPNHAHFRRAKAENPSSLPRRVRPTCGYRKRSPVRFHCFRLVLYNARGLFDFPYPYAKCTGPIWDWAIMPITFVPERGRILICDYDLARIAPEMDKERRVVVVSPRSYNQRHGASAGRCIVVPFSATNPGRFLTPADVPFP